MNLLKVKRSLMDVNIIQPREISHEWIQCTNCGWIGKTETAVMPGFDGLLSCPACSDMSVEEWHGPTSIEVPVDLLSDVLAKLCCGSLMIGNKDYIGEYAEGQRQCVLNVYERLAEHMDANGLGVKDEDEGEQMDLFGEESDRP